MKLSRQGCKEEWDHGGVKVGKGRNQIIFGVEVQED